VRVLLVEDEMKWLPALMHAFRSYDLADDCRSRQRAWPKASKWRWCRSRRGSCSIAGPRTGTVSH